MYYITLFIPILIFKRKKGREGERERRRERKKIMKEKEGEGRKGGHMDVNGQPDPHSLMSVVSPPCFRPGL